jgi:hypothetical protein
MPLSKSLRAYEHIRVILDHAITRGGARYTRENRADAARWRMEAYTFRKLYIRSVTKDGIAPPTPYDGMFLQIEGATVIITFRTREELYKGTLTDLDGKPIDKTTVPDASEEEDIFTEEAMDLRRKLFGDEEKDDDT